MRHLPAIRVVTLLLITITSTVGCADSNDSVENTPATTDEAMQLDIGDRPKRLASQLEEGSLRDALLSCETSEIERQAFSIGHRGAPLGYPEHTRESYLAAAHQGAGVLECDVTFTGDGELVCRHSQCDLHSSTNILETELADKCSIPPDPDSAQPYAAVQCCTSDLTLDEYRSLQGRHDSVNREATTLADYYEPGLTRQVSGGPDRGVLMTHAESITLFDELGVAMTPELKETLVPLNTDGPDARAELADKLVGEYVSAGIDPSRVFIQSFEESDIAHWIESAAEFAPNLVLLDDRYRDELFDPLDANSWQPNMGELVESGVTTLAPPLWVLVTLDENDQIVPSPYAIAARDAGLELVSWTLERSGNLADGGGFYYQSVSSAIADESDMLVVLDVLAQQAGVRAVFSDWPATTTYYAQCRLR